MHIHNTLHSRLLRAWNLASNFFTRLDQLTLRRSKPKWSGQHYLPCDSNSAAILCYALQIAEKMWWFIVKQPSLECSVVHKVVSRSVEMHNLPNVVRNLFSYFIKSAQLYDAQIPAFGGTATVSGSKISEEGGPSEGLGTEVTQWVKARSPRRESWRKVLRKSSNYTTHVRRRTVKESKTSLRCS